MKSTALALIAAGMAAITIACTSPTTPGAAYFYSNWSCGNQPQCISVMGHNVGSAGPFGTEPACRTWNTTYIPGTSSCNNTAIYPIYNGPTAGTCQN